MSIIRGWFNYILWHQRRSPRKIEYLEKYCKNRCLEFNINKTKVIIFNKTGRLIVDKFVIGEEAIECVKQYKYLGIVLSNTGKFTEARKILYEKALKASFKLYKDLKNASPSVKTLFHIFDHTKKPIALYGFENWGIRNLTNKRKPLSLYCRRLMPFSGAYRSSLWTYC